MTDLRQTRGSTSFKRLVVATSIWAFLLILVGSAIHVTGAGLDCQDWPLCFGQSEWSFMSPAWLSSTHRIVAGVAMLLTLSLAVLAWRSYRPYRLVLWPAAAAVLVIFGQAYIGAKNIGAGSDSFVAAVHLLLTLVYLALVLVVATVAHLPAGLTDPAGVRGQSQRYYLSYLLLTAAAIVLLLLSGVAVSGTSAGSACHDWPLCRGEIFPAQADPLLAINLLHRFSVIGVGALIAAVILQARRRYRESRLLARWSALLGLAFLVQVGLGGLNVLTRFPALLNTLHLLAALGIWAILVILTTVFYVSGRSLPVTDDEETVEPLPIRQKAMVYFKLTKPWIIILLLITTLGAMFIAARGLPPLSLVLYTLLGGALSAGGASALNSYVDSDIDGVMSRTSRRPTVTGLVTPQETLVFGLILGILSFLLFAIFVNLLSAALSTLGIIYYVFFYTLYLKRATIHNIIIGGAAGSIPPLVGWTAVTNSLDLSAFYLFAIIFFWTPPHTWALALLVKKDYARAKVPMLPVVAGDKETTYQILLYSILLIALTLLPFAANMMSLAYLFAATLLGAPFIYLAWQLWKHYDKSTSKRLYKFSQAYLALLFLAMALDRSLF